MTEVSSTRLYLGNLPRNATKADVEAHFATHGTGEITEIKLMNGFGFIEYKDAMDARDVVPAFHGSDFMGERLTVQFARGSRHREGGPTNGYNNNNERTVPKPRRTPHRMQISGLPVETSWQDLKDFARGSGLDVVFSEIDRARNGEGIVEFETAADLRTAIDKLDNREFKGQRVTCAPSTSTEFRGGDRGRSFSPRRQPRPPMDDYERRPNPRGYSPRGGRDSQYYRDRSPRRDYYDTRYRSPVRRPDDYPPPRGRYDEYARAPRDYPPDPYMGRQPPFERRMPHADYRAGGDPYPREPYPPREYGARY